MSEACDHNCGGCAKDCGDRKAPQDFSVPANQGSSVKKVIGVVSGKGGVGKSLVSALLAVEMNRRGFAAAVLDADVTGPSIPKAFGITQKAQGNETGLLPALSRTGIRIMSVNLLLENETDPVVWRGPVIGNTVKQFWTDVAWGDVDYLFVDMPPGTGDVALTVFQSLPVDGVIIVASPQELVAMIVSKAVKMAEMMHIPVLGLIENMSFFRCPDCGKEYRIFGESRIEATAARHGLKVLAKLPLDPALADACDNGAIEDFAGRPLSQVADIIEVSV